MPSLVSPPAPRMILGRTQPLLVGFCARNSPLERAGVNKKALDPFGEGEVRISANRENQWPAERIRCIVRACVEWTQS
jgi:hypothetical protein